MVYDTRVHASALPAWVKTVVILGALMVVAVGAGMVLRFSNVVPVGIPLVGKDSGIAACEAIASKGSKTGPAKTAGTTKAEEYRALRDVFANSRYAEIRDPGVRFVDLLRQVEGMGKNAGLGALAFLGPMTESYAALSGGCAEHGYTLPAMGG
jgi:hypothetical protein